MKTFKTFILESEEKHADEMFDPDSIEQHKHVGFKSRSKLVRMNIDHYLSLAKEGKDEDKAKDIKKSLDSGEKIKHVPELWINGDSSGKSDEHQVVGHEGRHRARELQRRGYTHMPVVLTHGHIRWDQQSDPKKFDYQEKWPTKLKNEDGNTTVPFPVKREDAEKSYK